MPETKAARCFLDTNIWLYAFIVSQNQEKSNIAKQIIESNEVVLSVQVINEITINLIKKAQFDEGKIRRLISSFFVSHQVIATESEVLLTASDLRSRHRFSFWDSLIVASALVGGCGKLYSENMHSGLRLTNDLQIVNPFELA